MVELPDILALSWEGEWEFIVICYARRMFLAGEQAFGNRNRYHPVISIERFDGLNGEVIPFQRKSIGTLGGCRSWITCGSILPARA